MIFYRHLVKNKGRWKASGKRVNRGLYRSAKGQVINAECNGAANIIKKVATQLSIDLAKVGRGVLMLPQRYKLDCLTKKYRISVRCVAIAPAPITSA